jgi:hypothetical protein
MTILNPPWSQVSTSRCGGGGGINVPMINEALRPEGTREWMHISTFS